MLSPKAARYLVTMQSALVGLQTIAAASILGDIIGAKPAALFMVLVAGAQQSVNYYTNRSVVDAVARTEDVVSTAHAVAEHASETVTALLQGNGSERTKPDG